ncbi:SHOCT domain-containing protein [Marinitoga lauensis]|uniref:SHOCT domain-containing protein n=1 Tax=Marinitoga lauensis TaxID=2201189 RepID=UPI0019821946|nr:SHOCT domain-containing protein [Marinitoga lauensis]
MWRRNIWLSWRGLFNRHYHSDEHHRHSDDLRRLEDSRQPVLEESNKKSRALDLLDEKFVNGEITEEEYLRKKKLILSNAV